MQLIPSCGSLEFWQLETSSGWFYPAADSNSGGWIRVAADSVLQLTWVLAAGCKFQLILSYNLLQFRCLDMSCSWFHPAADPNSSDWIRVVADFILQLTRVLVDGYKLWLISSHCWFKFQWLGRSCGWLSHTADSSSSSWTWVATDSILWLFWVLAAGYELWLTLSCGWLKSRQLDTSYSWLHPAADYQLQLILSFGWLNICRLDSACSWVIL